MRTVIGIDLGTTNCSVAYVTQVPDLPPEGPEIKVEPIPQVVNPGEVRDEPDAYRRSFLFYRQQSLVKETNQMPSTFAGIELGSRAGEVINTTVVNGGFRIKDGEYSRQ